MTRGRTTQPAGWYPAPDQAGYVRWWDGERWLDLVMPAGMAPAPASGWGKLGGVLLFGAKTWFWLLAIGLCCAVAWAALGG